MNTLNEQERKAILAMLDAMQRLSDVGSLSHNEAASKEYNETMEFCRKTRDFAKKHLTGFIA